MKWLNSQGVHVWLRFAHEVSKKKKINSTKLGEPLLNCAIIYAPGFLVCRWTGIGTNGVWSQNVSQSLDCLSSRLSKAVDLHVIAHTVFLDKWKMLFHAVKSQTKNTCKPFRFRVPTRYTSSLRWVMIPLNLRTTPKNKVMLWAPNSIFSDIDDVRGGYSKYWPGKEFVDIVGKWSIPCTFHWLNHLSRSLTGLLEPRIIFLPLRGWVS